MTMYIPLKACACVCVCMYVLREGERKIADFWEQDVNERFLAAA